MGFSPFGIDSFGGFGGGFGGGRGRGGSGGAAGTNAAPASATDTNAPFVPRPDSLALTYAILDYAAPAVLGAQGREAIITLTGETNAPQVVKLGDYTLTITPGVSSSGRGGGGMTSFVATNTPARFVVNPAPGEYVFVGGPMSVTFTANTPNPQTVRLGSFDESMYVDGRWVAGRRLNGDETDHDRRWPSMNSFSIYRYRVYQRD
jgi:hypothetical protein